MGRWRHWAQGDVLFLASWPWHKSSGRRPLVTVEEERGDTHTHVTLYGPFYSVWDHKLQRKHLALKKTWSLNVCIGHKKRYSNDATWQYDDTIQSSVLVCYHQMHQSCLFTSRQWNNCVVLQMLKGLPRLKGGRKVFPHLGWVTNKRHEKAKIFFASGFCVKR